MTEILEWRKAINDSSHPMSDLAWRLFQEEFNVEKTAKRYADQREEALPFLYLILDADELYYEQSLGSGFAPINAVSLLGEWQVVEAIPRLLPLITDDDDQELLVDCVVFALEKMPSEAIEPILEYGQEEAHAMDAVFILSKIGKGDERCFDFICSVFEHMTTEFDIITVAESLASNNLEKAESYFQEKTQKGPLRCYRKVLQKTIKQAKAGFWES